MDCEELVESLPVDLVERIRPASRADVNPLGEFVLYWMRSAIRTEENQALDVAAECATRLQLPVVVYQEVSSSYPFASDRHHTFILQGARDVQSEFARKHVNYLLHVERAGNRGSHLKTLARRAAVVITEDMPTEPMRSSTIELERDLPCSLLAVDTACIVPMQLVGDSYDRAFAFRNATTKMFADRVKREPTCRRLDQLLQRSIDVPFDCVDLQNCDIADLVSQCEIDHSIGPIPHTVGGFIAGYKRWNQFKENGLSTYDRRRNDPLIDGVSRLSPYLHYGMVAPMRIAREASAFDHRGAEKFLDELLIWRELAYVFCHFRRDHETISAIPTWAQATLKEHERDERELHSWETMARGRTGDSLWDSAQRSLLIHGELHNNVRMTWGKSVLQWTANAADALDRLIDLNHRYALDGSDPASYGGILWCLGQFDRPFTPEQPVIGTVRPRTTQQHAKRLDPSVFRRKATRCLWRSAPKVAIIGAGISGLICGRTLADQGCQVTVFEKSRGFGGRMATRLADNDLLFDHGAQFFTARSDLFKRHVQSWVDDGIVAPWTGRIVTIGDRGTQARMSQRQRFVAVPGMNALGKHLATDLDVRLEIRVSPPVRNGNRWALTDADENPLGEFDVALIATPANQAKSLLSGAIHLAAQARMAEMSPCWAMMLSLEKSLEAEFDGAFVEQSPIGWIAKNDSKPGRIGVVDNWVVHATHEWSQRHVEDSPNSVQRDLMDEFCRLVGCESLQSRYIQTHRWRYAIPNTPIDAKCLLDDELMLGACGDWCGGDRVEDAFSSGVALAGRVLGKLASTVPHDAANQTQMLMF